MHCRNCLDYYIHVISLFYLVKVILTLVIIIILFFTGDMLEEPQAIVEGYSSYFSFSRKKLVQISYFSLI